MALRVRSKVSRWYQVLSLFEILLGLSVVFSYVGVLFCIRIYAENCFTVSMHLARCTQHCDVFRSQLLMHIGHHAIGAV